MRIGIDFDNTIACYDGVFHAAALERGLIPPDLARDKSSIRDHLNGNGRRDEFTALQGHVYGACMDRVALYPGFDTFLVAARARGHDLFIVSHKSRTPILGPPHDLHAAANDFLRSRRVVGGSDAPIAPDRVFFETTTSAKVARAAALGCDVFIDDLPEILAMPGFPAAMRRILFDPDDRLAGQACEGIVERCTSWQVIAERVLQ